MATDSKSPSDLLHAPIETPVSESEEVQDTTINDLFSKDPNEISDEEVKQITAYMRSRREEWEKADGESKRGGGRPKKKSTTSAKTAGTIELGEISIDVDLD